MELFWAEVTLAKWYFIMKTFNNPVKIITTCWSLKMTLTHVLKSFLGPVCGVCKNFINFLGKHGEALEGNASWQDRQECFRFTTMAPQIYPPIIDRNHRKTTTQSKLTQRWQECDFHKNQIWEGAHSDDAIAGSNLWE